MALFIASENSSSLARVDASKNPRWLSEIVAVYVQAWACHGVRKSPRTLPPPPMQCRKLRI